MANINQSNIIGWTAQNETPTPVDNSAFIPVKSVVDETENPTAGSGTSAQHLHK